MNRNLYVNKLATLCVCIRELVWENRWDHKLYSNRCYFKNIQLVEGTIYMTDNVLVLDDRYWCTCRILNVCDCTWYTRKDLSLLYWSLNTNTYYNVTWELIKFDVQHT